MKLKKYTKSSRSSFGYWFNHWLAFQITAKKLGVWKFKYLFHDFEKPWLKLIWDYKRVQAFHRNNNRHHFEYCGTRGYDFEAMIIDWECSRLTKIEMPLNAREEAMSQIERHPERAFIIRKEILPRLDKLGL